MAYVFAQDAYMQMMSHIMCSTYIGCVEVASSHFLVYCTCVGGEKGCGMPYPPMFVWLGMSRILLASGEGASGASSCVNLPNENQQTISYNIHCTVYKFVYGDVLIEVLFVLL